MLHTWGQNLLLHPHVHCVIPAGGLSPDHKTWIHPRYRFFSPGGGPEPSVPRQVHRRAQAGVPPRVNSACRAHCNHWPTTRHSAPSCGRCISNDWVVYAKPPFGGPQHVLNYLARYTHRVAISNHRLVSFSDGKVTFRWKDYTHGNQHKTDDPDCGRVPAALPVAHASAWVRPHPLLRVYGQSATDGTVAGLQKPARSQPTTGHVAGGDNANLKSKPPGCALYAAARWLSSRDLPLSRLFLESFKERESRRHFLTVRCLVETSSAFC